jgi:hypothetical protein
VSSLVDDRIGGVFRQSTPLDGLGDPFVGHLGQHRLPSSDDVKVGSIPNPVRGPNTVLTPGLGDTDGHPELLGVDLNPGGGSARQVIHLVVGVPQEDVLPPAAFSDSQKLETRGVGSRRG